MNLSVLVVLRLVCGAGGKAGRRRGRVRPVGQGVADLLVEAAVPFFGEEADGR
ncbi:hypothetical protein OG705_29740 [Streptomyces sp. NBC_00838]|uniref:hypothetical protein n=1 Tax=Streptomyces sp. NBC_00838 TaxID=2903680 RepID=UPI00386FD505|nr:hypothetical protein OG705_29740 [Streptomyces sp. NBC_00838]